MEISEKYENNNNKMSVVNNKGVGATSSINRFTNCNVTITINKLKLKVHIFRSLWIKYYILFVNNDYYYTCIIKNACSNK